MPVRITSHHGSAITFPVVIERLNTSRFRVTETTGEHFTIEPGERTYERVPANVLDAIRKHHVPGGLMRIAGEG